MAFIHVIIPCYNVEKYLEQAVYSVLNQPCKDIDVVLVDDGSPGSTPQLCDELAALEERVHVIHKSNGGLSDARNAGIEYALSYLVQSERELLAFLDGDDAWKSDVLDEEVVSHLQTDWLEDVISFSGVLANNALDRFSAKLSTLEHSSVDARSMMWHSHSSHLGAKLFRVEMFQKWRVRFQYKQLYTEDRIFLVQFYFLAEKARFVNKTLHIYRKNRVGIMGSLQKLSAADHYLPIVDGWLKCDVFLNNLTARTLTTATMGQILAVTYLVEMVSEHIEKGGNLKDILKILEEHPHYPAVREASLVQCTAQVYKKNRLLFEHSLYFTIKYRLIGLLKRVATTLLSIPFVANLYEKYRYPLTTIPE